MNTKRTYQGQVTVTFNFSINLEKLYLVVYYNLLLERGRVDQTIHDSVFNEYVENDVYYLNDIFEEDIMRYHNHEAIRFLFLMSVLNIQLIKKMAYHQTIQFHHNIYIKVAIQLVSFVLLLL